MNQKHYDVIRELRRTNYILLVTTRQATENHYRTTYDPLLPLGNPVATSPALQGFAGPFDTIIVEGLEPGTPAYEQAIRRSSKANVRIMLVEQDGFTEFNLHRCPSEAQIEARTKELLEANKYVTDNTGIPILKEARYTDGYIILETTQFMEAGNERAINYLKHNGWSCIGGHAILGNERQRFVKYFKVCQY